MKFLCDSCKAKYQIADDKVAGKTVRMKCRKCGHLIEIRAGAALAEATSMRSLPPEELSQVTDATSTAPPPAAAASVAPRPAGASVAPAAPRAAPRPATTPLPAATARKPAAPVPGPKGTVPMRAVGGAATAAAVARAPEPEIEPPPPASGPARGGLASAFSKSVEAPSHNDDPATRVLAIGDMGADAAEEWYAGVSGVPVGPMRLSELRAKIAAGQVTEESLVWREGFEEWVALRTVPSLHEIFRAGQQAERLSVGPATTRQSKAPTAKGNVVPITNRSDSAIRAGQPAEAPGAQTAEAPATADAPVAPLAPPEPAKEPSGPVLGVAMADPFAAPAPLPPPPARSKEDDFLLGNAPMGAVAAFPVEAAPARPAAPARIPPAAWVVVVLALAVSFAAGSLLFSKPPPPPQVQIVTVTAPTPNAPLAAQTDNPSAQNDPSTPDPKADPSAPKKTGPAPVALAPGLKPSAAATGTAAALPTTTTTAPALALAPLPTMGAPDPNPTPAPPPASADPIPAGKLQEVVSGGRNALRRACWEPAISSRGGGGPSSVKINVSLNIAPGGRVSRVSTSGGDTFPTLGPCIVGRVKNWSFPAGYAETPTSFTLSFVSQG